ncbi:MAG: YdcH family protein [Terriglobales bacterium]
MDPVQDFSRLAAEHSALDAQLEKLKLSRYPSPDELMEAQRLKKMKLQLKDAMRIVQT